MPHMRLRQLKRQGIKENLFEGFDFDDLDSDDEVPENRKRYVQSTEIFSEINGLFLL